jgi:hypothetical protein
VKKPISPETIKPIIFSGAKEIADFIAFEMELND